MIRRFELLFSDGETKGNHCTVSVKIESNWMKGVVKSDWDNLQESLKKAIRKSVHNYFYCVDGTTDSEISAQQREAKVINELRNDLQKANKRLDTIHTDYNKLLVERTEENRLLNERVRVYRDLALTFKDLYYCHDNVGCGDRYGDTEENYLCPTCKLYSLAEEQA